MVFHNFFVRENVVHCMDNVDKISTKCWFLGRLVRAGNWSVFVRSMHLGEGGAIF